MTEHLDSKECTGCGAVAEYPQRGISTMCAYCDSPLVDSKAAMGHIDRVAPFRIQRSVAEQKLKQHLAGHFWAPQKIKKGILEEHRLRAVLVPFWAYTAVARSTYQGKVGIWWYKTVTYVDSKGKTRTRQERRTEWFPHSGSSIRQVEGHLASASVGLPEQDSNELEPFDLGRAMSFEARLVAGWEAEIPSVGGEVGEAVLRQEVSGIEATRIVNHLLPGNEGKVESIQTEMDIEKVEIVLLPVWMASWRHGDKVIRQMVNGQTGKVIGEIPSSGTKIGVAVLVLVAVFAALYLGWNG